MLLTTVDCPTYLNEITDIVRPNLKYPIRICFLHDPYQIQNIVIFGKTVELCVYVNIVNVGKKAQRNRKSLRSDTQ